MNPHLQTLCVVTNQLAESVDELLTPDFYEELRRAKREFDDAAATVVQAERDIAQRESADPVEFEVESEEREGK